MFNQGANLLTLYIDIQLSQNTSISFTQN